MANVKITELTALTDPASTDVLPIVDVVADITKKISIADLLENAGSGTAAAPGIAFDGDSNTGIYRPGADQLAISTSGTQRLVVDSTGQIEAKSLGSASAPTWSFVDDPNTGIYSPGANQLALATNGAQALYINADGDILVADGNRMEIDEVRARDGAGLKLFDDGGAGIFVEDGGNVGVGTSSPDAPLHVLSGGGVVRNAVNDGTAAGTAAYALNSSNGAYDMAQITATQGAAFANPVFKIRVSDTSKNLQDRLTILSSGNVGIGTTSPSNTLQVGATTSASSTSPVSMSLGGQYTPDASITYSNLKLKVYDAGTDAAGFSAGQTNGLCAVSPANSPITFITQAGGGALTERVRIDTSGRLLVGTSSASDDALLKVNGPLQVEGVRIAYHGRSYTASTSATDLFKVRMTTGHGAAEFTWMFVDFNFPNGARIGKIYLVFRGSGSNISAVNIASSTEASITSGTVTGISWSASVHDDNHVKLTATGTATSGSGTMYIYGSSPFFASLTPISDV